MNKKWNRKACQQENQPGEKKLLINEKRDRKACRQEKRKQREIIRRMDEKLITYREDSAMLQIVKWFYIGISVLLLFLPPEICLDKDERSIAITVLLWTAVISPMGYFASYRNLKEQGKTVSYLKKIKYLPLDIRQVKLVRIGYLAQFLKKIVLVACVEQIIFGTLICGQNMIFGIAYAVMVGGLIPLAWNSLIIWLE